MNFIKIILLILFFTCGCLYTLGEIADIGDIHGIASLSSTPFLLAYYLVATKKINWLYVIALIALAIGLTQYNLSIKKLNSIGPLVLTINLIIYNYIIFDKKNIFSTKHLTVVVVSFFVSFIGATFFILKDVSDDFFIIALIFSSFAWLYLYIGYFNYRSHPTRENKLILISGIALIISSITSGINSFIEINAILRVIEVVTFFICNYFMCCYVLKTEKKTL